MREGLNTQWRQPITTLGREAESNRRRGCGAADRGGLEGKRYQDAVRVIHKARNARARRYSSASLLMSCRPSSFLCRCRASPTGLSQAATARHPPRIAHTFHRCARPEQRATAVLTCRLRISRPHTRTQTARRTETSHMCPKSGAKNPHPLLKQARRQRFHFVRAPAHTHTQYGNDTVSAASSASLC